MTNPYVATGAACPGRASGRLAEYGVLELAPALESDGKPACAGRPPHSKTGAR